jgi:hypothetical protein
MIGVKKLDMRIYSIDDGRHLTLRIETLLSVHFNAPADELTMT